ncbi:MAG TPA: GNAT family N-acetyltransferase [Ferruginibacter sp.]|nr:GNAT family N-acetyltransferase [Ferruginibacter sp.]
MISIQKVGTEAIPQIVAVANASWRPTYKDILSEAQMDFMMDLFYALDNIRQQITQQQHQFIIATENNEPLGFAAYSLKHIDNSTLYRLHRIYIDPQQHGKGIGKMLLDFVINDIKPKGAQYINLNVNRYNKAVGFYKKAGFEIIGEEDLPVGNGYFMNDYKMLKTL